MTWATRNQGAARVGIATLVLFLYGMSLATLAVYDIPTGNRDSFAMLIGGLNNAVGMVIGYWFNIAQQRQTP
jgi:hypothetical protein